MIQNDNFRDSGVQARFRTDLAEGLPTKNGEQPVQQRAIIVLKKREAPLKDPAQRVPKLSRIRYNQQI
jgi:hypothetical protein